MVDVLELVASARLILRPGEEHCTDCQYTIPLEAADAATDGTGTCGAPVVGAEAKKLDKEMSVTIAVAPADETAGDDKIDKDGAVDESRPGTAKKRVSSASNTAASRHGQANAAREYLDKHNLVEFTQLLVQSVIKEQPDRPYAFMARQFYFPEPQPRKGAASSKPEGRSGVSCAAPPRSALASRGRTRCAPKMCASLGLSAALPRFRGRPSGTRYPWRE